jgi:hypothetical protein
LPTKADYCHQKGCGDRWGELLGYKDDQVWLRYSDVVSQEVRSVIKEIHRICKLQQDHSILSYWLKPKVWHSSPEDFNSSFSTLKLIFQLPNEECPATFLNSSVPTICVGTLFSAYDFRK